MLTVVISSNTTNKKNFRIIDYKIVAHANSSNVLSNVKINSNL